MACFSRLEVFKYLGTFFHEWQNYIENVMPAFGTMDHDHDFSSSLGYSLKEIKFVENKNLCKSCKKENMTKMTLMFY